MGTKTRYLHLAAATAIALSATPGSPSRSATVIANGWLSHEGATGF